MREQAERMFRLNVINLGLIRAKEIMACIEQDAGVMPAAHVPSSHASKTRKRNDANVTAIMEAATEPVSAEEASELQQAQDELMRTGTHPIIANMATSINRSMEAFKMVQERPGHRVTEYAKMLEQMFPNIKTNWYSIVYNLSNPTQAGYKGVRKIDKCLYPPEEAQPTA